MNFTESILESPVLDNLKHYVTLKHAIVLDKTCINISMSTCLNTLKQLLQAFNTSGFNN